METQNKKIEKEHKYLQCYDCESKQIEEGFKFNELLGYNTKIKPKCKKCGSYRIIDIREFDD